MSSAESIAYDFTVRAPQTPRRLDEADLLAAPAVQATLEQILRHLALVVPYDSAAILLQHGRRLRVAAAHGLPAAEVRHTLESYERRTLAAHVIRSGMPLAVTNVQKHPLWTASFGTGYIHSWVGAPLQGEGRIFGAINADKREIGYYTERDAQVLLAFARQAAAALEKACLAQEVHRLHIETILALVNAVEARDPFTGGHSLRVAQLAVVLGRPVGLLDEELKALYLGGLLHDVGKIGISDAVLLKSGALSTEEMALIQMHPAKGSEIVGKVGRFQYLKPMIVWHHERYDGEGYPDELFGEEIPLQSRIMAVADGLEAMISARVYRPAIPLPRALQIFREDRGRQWDPQLV